MGLFKRKISNLGIVTSYYRIGKVYVDDRIYVTLFAYTDQSYRNAEKEQYLKKEETIVSLDDEIVDETEATEIETEEIVSPVPVEEPKPMMNVVSEIHIILPLWIVDDLLSFKDLYEAIKQLDDWKDAEDI